MKSVPALEAYNIYRAFHKDSSPVPVETLKRALSGPLQPIEENQKNRDGRNIWFELTLAAEWRLRGASVSLGEPDLRLTRDGIPFLVACKRPASNQNIDANLRAAFKQLEANLDTVPVGTLESLRFPSTASSIRGTRSFQERRVHSTGFSKANLPNASRTSFP